MTALATSISPGRDHRGLRDAVLGCPTWCWPALAAAAMWPSVAWSVRRFSDGSDDPFGIVALVALAIAVVVAAVRGRCSGPLRQGVLTAAGVVAVATACLPPATSELLRATTGTLAVVLAFAAIVDEGEPFAAYAGLAFLALPVLSSLQFYAGFPLRVVTAEATRWLLAAIGSSAVRDGSALVVDGHLILVDAPCSGVRMAWVGYFTACATARLLGIGDRAALSRLPFVGLLVLAGNIVRNTILVILEAGDGPVAASVHDGVGLAVLAVVCLAIVATFAHGARRVRSPARVRIEPGIGAARPEDGPLLPAALFCAAVAIATIVASGGTRPAAASDATRGHVEWPIALDGRPLTPIALSDVERRFAGAFPGVIARFSNGPRVVVLRDVDRATRRLHPATDCYRALGYRISDERLRRPDGGGVERCFRAVRHGQAMQVCESIVAADGARFTDTSSWYWSALLGSSSGPWRATTIAVPDAGGTS